MKNIVREPAVAGSFYPGGSEKLNSQLQQLFHDNADIEPVSNVAAIVVPHAGYVFSGDVAAAAFSTLPEKSRWDNIFVIASSHHHQFAGAALPSVDEFKTPLGPLKVNREVVLQLADDSDGLFAINEASHDPEHSIEVQLPFIQYRYGGSMPIVPILLGCHDADTCSRIADVLRPWFNEKNLFVISTDFSHYPSYDDAVMVDKLTASAILSGNPVKLMEQLKENSQKQIYNLQTSLCGWTSVLTLLYIINGLTGYSLSQIKYENSGDKAMGDHDRVVGYWAIQVQRRKIEEAGFALDDSEKAQLLQWAHECLKGVVNRTEVNVPNVLLKNEMRNQAGIFVSLYKNGKLRGCIGRFVSGEPLWRLVKEVTRSSATCDTRFMPVEADELSDMTIELSVLTPLKRIDSIDEIELGRHGIYIKKGMRSGTFLPQVADKTGWAKEEFVEHCARDKAGLTREEWRSAEIFTYEAIVFGDEKR
jgi:AmmeMemoRadiSam system protein B/AmmeMemoRadiSam system protein A